MGFDVRVSGWEVRVSGLHGSVILTDAHSWNASVPTAAVGTWPEKQTIGTESPLASAVGNRAYAVCCELRRSKARPGQVGPGWARLGALGWASLGLVWAGLGRLGPCSGVIMFVSPGPDVTSATPVRPVALAYLPDRKLPQYPESFLAIPSEYC